MIGNRWVPAEDSYSRRANFIELKGNKFASLNIRYEKLK